MMSTPSDSGRSAFVNCLTNDLLHLVLMPTEACNFRCVYCYETFALGRMPRPVVDGLKALLARRAPRLHLLTLSWFGGEPLLARDLIREIMLHAAQLAASHRFPIVSDMTTNGYLLNRPVFEELLDFGVTRYQISFDGPQAWHDRKRLRADGAGTFDKIWGHVVAMREVQREFTIVVRVHADRENRAALPEFLDAYRETFGSDARFRLFVRPLSRLGGARDAELQIFDATEAHAAITELRRTARDRQLASQEPDPEDICYAARANSFVVRADGRLNKCTVALEHPGNQVGRLLEDGSVELEAPLMNRWMRGIWSGDAEALHCPLQHYDAASEMETAAATASILDDSVPVAFHLESAKAAAALE